jgi:hypothetical protein
MVATGKRERTRYVRYAKATFGKDRRLNICLSSRTWRPSRKREQNGVQMDERRADEGSRRQLQPIGWRKTSKGDDEGTRRRHPDVERIAGAASASTAR